MSVDFLCACSSSRHPKVENTKVVQMKYIYPFKSEFVEKLLKKCKKLICIEGNMSGQIEGVLREHTGIKADHSIRNPFGRPMTGEWIAEEVKKLL